MSPELVNILARIYAVQAELEAMKVANYERGVTQSVVAYSSEEFYRCQYQLEELAIEAASL